MRGAAIIRAKQLRSAIALNKKSPSSQSSLDESMRKFPISARSRRWNMNMNERLFSRFQAMAKLLNEIMKSNSIVW